MSYLQAIDCNKYPQVLYYAFLDNANFLQCHLEFQQYPKYGLKWVWLFLQLVNIFINKPHLNRPEMAVTIAVWDGKSWGLKKIFYCNEYGGVVWSVALPFSTETLEDCCDLDRKWFLQAQNLFLQSSKHLHNYIYTGRVVIFHSFGYLVIAYCTQILLLNVAFDCKEAYLSFLFYYSTDMDNGCLFQVPLVKLLLV